MPNKALQLCPKCRKPFGRFGKVCDCPEGSVAKVEEAPAPQAPPVESGETTPTAKQLAKIEKLADSNSRDQLRQKAKKLGLKVSGSKTDIATRIVLA